MHRTWRVEQVTEKPGIVLADLVPVEWFKKNPEHEEMEEEYDALVESDGDAEAERQFA